MNEDIEFIGARDLTSLQELDAGPFSSKYNWNTPPQIPYKPFKPFRRNIDEMYRLALLK